MTAVYILLQLGIDPLKSKKPVYDDAQGRYYNNIVTRWQN